MNNEYLLKLVCARTLAPDVLSYSSYPSTSRALFILSYYVFFISSFFLIMGSFDQGRLGTGMGQISDMGINVQRLSSI